MKFNSHTNFANSHSFLSPSAPHWLNYSSEKMSDVFYNRKAIVLGTRLHAFAAEAIRLKQRLPRSRKSLNSFVNDAIGYGLEVEVLLFYSQFAYGTTDAIGYFPRKNLLRIHDLKTGTTPAKMTQLEVYTALFCLEYDHTPSNLEMELRIYQNSEILVHNPSQDRIRGIMDKIIMHSDLLTELDQEGGYPS